MTGARMRPIEAPDVAATARLLAECFEANPAYATLFPERAGRRSRLADFYALNLRMHLRHRCSYVWVDAAAGSSRDRVLATVTVRPPGGVGLSRREGLRAGLLGFVRRNGLGVMPRLSKLGAAYERLEREVSGGAPHWYVHMMAVSPDRQGEGLGSKLLGAVLATTADSRAPVADTGIGRDYPTVLSTQQEINLSFYARFGFTPIDERPMEGVAGEPLYPCWSMLRKSRA